MRLGAFFVCFLWSCWCKVKKKVAYLPRVGTSKFVKKTADFSHAAPMLVLLGNCKKRVSARKSIKKVVLYFYNIICPHDEAGSLYSE